MYLLQFLYNQYGIMIYLYIYSDKDYIIADKKVWTKTSTYVDKSEVSSAKVQCIVCSLESIQDKN